MDELQLSETEKRYFGDLFVCCDVENTGKVPQNKAFELFRSGNVGAETLKQISDICQFNGAVFNRGQFYAFLKLIAAHQANVALNDDVLRTAVDVPLPRFTWPATDLIELQGRVSHKIDHGIDRGIDHGTDHFERDSDHFDQGADHFEQGADHFDQGADHFERSTDHFDHGIERIDHGIKRIDHGIKRSDHVIKRIDHKDHGTDRIDHGIDHTDHGIDHTDHGTDHMDQLRHGSPEMSSTASDSPTPTNSVQERNWAALGDWQGLCEEQRQLLGTEEESSDRHSSEEDTEITSEVWTITAEQRDYYAQQFKHLQPDLRGFLAGNVARKFFEKSMLPVAELRKIWQLSDVTKDGQLDLEEFNTAMHLVVLRRNHICLPAVLPNQLNPAAAAVKHPQEKPRPLSPQINAPSSPQTKETWTKFIDSPTSSPGPKPVNFDFQKASVETDPKILHPKALRLTPEINNQPGEELEDIRPIQRPQAKKLIVRGTIPPPPQQNSCGVAACGVAACGITGGGISGGGISGGGISGVGLSGGGISGVGLSGAGISGGAISGGGLSGGAPSDDAPLSLPAPKKDKPPPPPPRPLRTHARSSSLDLNRLGKNGLGAPPSIPPRVSPNISAPLKKLINQRSEGGDTFADFERFEVGAAPLPPEEKYENVSEADQTDSVGNPPAEPQQQIRRHGAFEVYRKPVAPVAVVPVTVGPVAVVPGAVVPVAVASGAVAPGVVAPGAVAPGAVAPAAVTTNTVSTNAVCTAAVNSAVDNTGAESPIPAEDSAKYELYKKLKEQNLVLVRLCQELSQELADVREERTTLRLRLEQQQSAS